MDRQGICRGAGGDLPVLLHLAEQGVPLNSDHPAELRQHMSECHPRNGVIENVLRRLAAAGQSLEVRGGEGWGTGLNERYCPGPAAVLHT